jgi:hypothetical protein
MFGGAAVSPFRTPTFASGPSHDVKFVVTSKIMFGFDRSSDGASSLHQLTEIGHF